MGFLDKWRKKRDQERLDRLEDSQTPKTEKPVKIVKEAKPKVVEKPATEKKIEVSKKVIKKGKSQIAHKVLISSIISEKAAVAESLNTYTFIVAVWATKMQIKNAVAQVYNVQPKKVRIMNLEGKRIRFGRRWGRRKNWKKAIVTLPKGQTISIHEGV